MSINFISHLLDSRFNSVLKSMGAYLVLDSLVVLMVLFIGVSYSTKVYKYSDMSKMGDRSFIIMNPEEIGSCPLRLELF